MSSAVATQTADLSTALRIAANEKFAARDFAGAAAGYSAALEAATDAQAAVSALSNRAACWLRLGVPVRALDDISDTARRAASTCGCVTRSDARSKHRCAQWWMRRSCAGSLRSRRRGCTPQRPLRTRKAQKAHALGYLWSWRRAPFFCAAVCRALRAQRSGGAPRDVASTAAARRAQGHRR